MTAWLEGPGCFVIVWAFLNRHPMRHVLQMGVSIGQFYGELIIVDIGTSTIDFKKNNGNYFSKCLEWTKTNLT